MTQKRNNMYKLLLKNAEKIYFSLILIYYKIHVYIYE